MKEEKIRKEEEYSFSSYLHRFSLFLVVTFCKVAVNIEFMNTESLLLGETQE